MIIEKDNDNSILEGDLNVKFDSLMFDWKKDSLCQNIIMSREIRHNENISSSCKHFITFHVRIT